MAFVPIARHPIQYEKEDGNPAAGYYLKFYLANSSTPINMATDATGATQIAKCRLSEAGYPLSNPLDQNSVFIPHLSTDYATFRFVIYLSAADADANVITSGLPNIQSIGNTYDPSADLSAFIKTVATFADISAALTTLTIGQQISLVGHTVSGVGGGIFDVVSYLGVTADNGMAVVNGAKAAKRAIPDSIPLSAFGAVIDGSADATAALNNALASCPDGMFIDGQGYEYLITGTVSTAKTYCRLKNFRFKTTTTYSSQGKFTITSLYVHLKNVFVDFGRGSYKTGSEPWEVFTTFGGYDSIVPTLDAVFSITNYSQLARVLVENTDFKNVHADACLKIATYGTVILNGHTYKNCSNKTYHVLHSPDNGVTQYGRTIANNVYSEDIGILPDTFLVDGVSTLFAGATCAPQGSFNFIVSFGDYSLTNAVCWNYASTGVTSDRNKSFNYDNLTILNTSNRCYSNNPSGAFWIEDTINTNGSNLLVVVTQRDGRDLTFDSSLLQLYFTDDKVVNMSNTVAITSTSSAKVNKLLRASVFGDVTISMINTFIDGLAGTTAKAFDVGVLPNSVVGHEVTFENLTLKSGDINVDQPKSLVIRNAKARGVTSGGNVTVGISGNPGITGNVEKIEIDDSEIAGSITNSTNATVEFSARKSIVNGSITSAASSGVSSVEENTKIGGSVLVTGPSSTSGVVSICGNKNIVGTTTITAAKNATINSNTTERRIEIKDVQTFVCGLNTAKTNVGESIIWVNPVTAANILAGVISSNNVLIKTATGGAGYVTIAGGVVGVTDVNNNKLTVNYS